MDVSYQQMQLSTVSFATYFCLSRLSLVRLQTDIIEYAMKLSDDSSDLRRKVIGIHVVHSCGSVQK